MSPITTSPRPASHTARARIAAFTLLLVGVVAVVVLVLAAQRRLEPWITVGSSVAESVPPRAAVGVFAMRTSDDKLAVTAIGRGTKARCLDIRFEIDNRRGATEEAGGARCRVGVIGGRGVRVEPNRTVRVFAGGRFLVEVKSVDTRTCGAHSNVCAMAFDRRGTRLPLQTRKRRAGEVERDDLLRSTLQSGGSGDRYAAGGQPVAEVAVEQFGAITAQVWPASLAVDVPKVGGKKPTPSQTLAALFTRAPDGFTVRVVDDGARRARSTTAD